MRNIKHAKLTAKHQATIPIEVCKSLHLHTGDQVAFEIFEEEGFVILRKAVPFDREYARAVSQTLSEWSSKEDDDAFKDLQNL
ncbi:MAG: Transcriptional regulator, AbrB family [candidate division TM6 bacterium GW2011_GWF2_43_87]|nr:MAG: Transcriptional regulator, AbrB family [candidate division TM6 bacterium GW2011_GWF2_43_87]